MLRELLQELDSQLTREELDGIITDKSDICELAGRSWTASFRRSTLTGQALSTLTVRWENIGFWYNRRASACMVTLGCGLLSNQILSSS